MNGFADAERAMRMAAIGRAAVAAGLTLAAAASTAAAEAAAGPAGVGGDGEFAAAVYGRVAAGSAGNVFLSPYSVRTALAMAATGAAGTTRRQMADVLRLPAGSADQTAAAFFRSADGLAGGADGCELDVANGIWVGATAPLRPAYVDLVTRGFGASARSADFAADPDGGRRDVNDWAANRTRQKVLGLLPPGSVKPDTQLILANAVYFKGAWADPFLPRSTTDQPFHLGGGRDVPVPMMMRGDRAMAVYQSSAVSAVELPYRGGRASMLVVIPAAVDGLAAVERGLTAAVVRTWTDGLRPTDAVASLPRFTATGTFELGRTLQGMGMAAAFGDGADFGPMLAPGAKVPLKLGAVYHKAVVTVDEQGTEAAAASAVAMPVGAAPPRTMPVQLVADRPFLYLIRDRATGTVLFIGRCVDPRA